MACKIAVVDGEVGQVYTVVLFVVVNATPAFLNAFAICNYLLS